MINYHLYIFVLIKLCAYMTENANENNNNFNQRAEKGIRVVGTIKIKVATTITTITTITKRIKYYYTLYHLIKSIWR